MWLKYKLLLYRSGWEKFSEIISPTKNEEWFFPGLVLGEKREAELGNMVFAME